LNPRPVDRMSNYLPFVLPCYLPGCRVGERCLAIFCGELKATNLSCFVVDYTVT